SWFFFFFFQAEDGIRDKLVTGVQTCALPISFTPAGATWMCAMNTLSMLDEISRYATSVPSSLNCSLIWPTARVSRVGTSFPPMRWATKFFASGTGAGLHTQRERAVGIGGRAA